MFACYSHENADAVYREIAWLNEHAVNVWYDEGISPGLEWRDEIATAIQGCSRVLFFVSPQAVVSEHCRRELNFAQEENREVVAIHLERTEIPPGLRLGLNNRQAILKHELSEQEFRDRLIRVAQADGGAAQTVPLETKKPAPKVLPAAMIAVVISVVAAVGWFVTRDMTPEPSAVGDVASPPAVTLLPNSIAVLPFENLSPDPDNAYFAAGMHEEILNQLAKIKELSVIARTSVQTYADGTKAIPQIGRELNVSTVMEGSVRYAGNRVRVTAQLIDAKSGLHLWSDAYDRDLEDTFEIQSEIARNVTSALKVQFAVAEQQSISKKPTDNPQAYAHYLSAVAVRQNLDSLDPVHQGLDQAIALDPNFAQAMALKAWLYGFQTEAPFTGNVPTPESQRNYVQLAQEYAERAIAIDPDQAEAHLALSIVDQYYRRWDGRLAKAKKAYELNPNHYAIAFWYGRALLREGRIDEGIPIIERAAELDPRNWSIHYFFGLELGWAQRWERAKQQLKLVQSMVPEFSGSYSLLALFGAFTDDQALALENAETLDARGAGRAIPPLMVAYSNLGRVDEVSRLFQAATNEGLTEHFNDADWVSMYVAMGKDEKALDHIESLVEKNFPFSWIYNMRDHSDHPLWGDLNRHGRFTEILTRLEEPL